MTKTSASAFPMQVIVASLKYALQNDLMYSKEITNIYIWAGLMAPAKSSPKSTPTAVLRFCHSPMIIHTAVAIIISCIFAGLAPLTRANSMSSGILSIPSMSQIFEFNDESPVLVCLGTANKIPNDHLLRFLRQLGR